MIRGILLAATLVLPPVAAAGSVAVEVAEQASAALGAAAEQLSQATTARDRISALTTTVRAYEDGLAALREGIRQAALRERTIRQDFDDEEDRLSRLLGALISMQSSPEALVLLHPDGPLASARAGILIADVAPAIEARVATLRGALDELGQLQALQQAASETLQEGLDGAQEARTLLAQAVADRKVTSALTAPDIATLQALVGSADTLQGFASTLASLPDLPGETDPAFGAAKGALPPPVAGAPLTAYNEADASGRREPGIRLATAPLALVTAPHSGTIRYAGPLLDRGQVVILEPEAGYLVILSGLGQVFAASGDIVETGDPVGLMTGTSTGVEQKLIESGEGSGQDRSETLYIEVRQGEATLDPSEWFALAGNKDQP